MKRIIKTLPAVMFLALLTVSCNNNSQKNDSTQKNDSAQNDKSTKKETDSQPLTPPQFGNLESIDTLSYIQGMSISHHISSIIMPQLKLDYNVIIENLISGIDGKESFKVGNITITKENFAEIGMKLLGPDIAPKIQAAMADSTGNTQVFDNAEDKKIASTLIAADLVYSLGNEPFKIDAESFKKGINDTYNGTPSISDESATLFMQNYYTVVIPANNKKASEEWLASIEKQDGVKKTGSGLLYKVIKEGDKNTKATKDEDVVKVIYPGKTRKDKVFDSNRWTDMTQQRKEMYKVYQPEMVGKDNPIEFALNQVIKGWTEGMKLIGKGGRIHLWIPAELAYGERGVGQDIGPNEALFFDVELLEVTSK